MLSVSLFSAARGEKGGYFYDRCPEGYGELKGRRGNVKLERSGGLDHLVGGEGQHVFRALLTPGSVDGGYCRVDDVDMEHLRGRHLEFATCTSMTMRGRQHRRQDDRETAGAGREVCADLTGRLPLAYNGSEYLFGALRRETRFGFVKALTNKRSETVKKAMVDMQLLFRGVWRYHSDEGREFMGAVDSWLREHTVLDTTTGAYDPNANSLIEESVGARKRGIRCLLHQANAPVSLWPDAAEHANEIYNHSKRPVPGQTDVVEPIVLERRAFSGQAECDLLPRERERPSSWPPWGCLAFAIKLEHPAVRRESLEPIALQEILVGWNRRVPHGINIATFRDDGEVEEVFTSTTVRTRDTVFPLIGDAGMRSATEAELSRVRRECESETR